MHQVYMGDLEDAELGLPGFQRPWDAGCGVYALGRRWLADVAKHQVRVATLQMACC